MKYDKSVGFGRKMLHILLIGITILVTIMGILFYRVTNWILQTWGIISIEEIIFHLKVPLEGTNSDMIIDAVQYCLPWILVAVNVVAIIIFCLRNKKKYQYTCMVGTIVITTFMGGFGIRTAWTQLSVSAYIQNRNIESTFIEEHYVDPNKVEITFPEKKRNLIYIFLESMESTYGSKENGGAYDSNYISELGQIASENINFSNTDLVGGAYQTIGATWTIAGMFSQTCGMPLILPISANQMSEQKEFFPKIINLGDILKKQGYNQNLMIGSSASFGGRENYFKQHGDYQIFDYDYALKNSWIPEGYRVFWGYEDKRLFEQAKIKLTELGQREEPFNFTMLTVDTHFEDGYVCDICGQGHDNQYANVIACASKQVGDFISWIQEQPFYDNTTIVISGDHLTMDSDFCVNIPEDYDRTIYNTIINSQVVPAKEKNRKFTTQDLFPTTLASLGVTIEGNRLGLGTNLFSGEPTLLERYSLEDINQEFNKNSDFYNVFTEDIKEVDWKKEDGKWYYYFDENTLATGWQYINNAWYYFYEDGVMASDERVEGYYLGVNGDWDWKDPILE